MIHVRCPACKKDFRLSPELAGRKIRCNGCSEKFRIEDETVVAQPEPSEPVASALVAARCPRCLAEYDLKPKYAGKSVQCKTCSTAFVVPAPKPSAPEPDEDSLVDVTPVFTAVKQPVAQRPATLPAKETQKRPPAKPAPPPEPVELTADDMVDDEPESQEIGFYDDSEDMRQAARQGARRSSAPAPLPRTPYVPQAPTYTPPIIKKTKRSESVFGPVMKTIGGGILAVSIFLGRAYLRYEKRKSWDERHSGRPTATGFADNGPNSSIFDEGRARAKAGLDGLSAVLSDTSFEDERKREEQRREDEVARAKAEIERTRKEIEYRRKNQSVNSPFGTNPQEALTRIRQFANPVLPPDADDLTKGLIMAQMDFPPRQIEGLKILQVVDFKGQDRKVFDVLKPMMDKRGTVSKDVARAIVRCNVPEMPEFLASKLSSPFNTWLLPFVAELKHPATVEPMLQRLLFDSKKVVDKALIAIGPQAEDEVIEALDAYGNRVDLQIRLCEVLAIIGTSKSIEALERVTRSIHQPAHPAANHAIEEIRKRQK